MCSHRSAVWMHGRSFFAVSFTRESHLCGVGAPLAVDAPNAPKATTPSTVSHDHKSREHERCNKEPSPSTAIDATVAVASPSLKRNRLSRRKQLNKYERFSVACVDPKSGVPGEFGQSVLATARAPLARSGRRVQREQLGAAVAAVNDHVAAATLSMNESGGLQGIEMERDGAWSQPADLCHPAGSLRIVEPLEHSCAM